MLRAKKVLLDHGDDYFDEDDMVLLLLLLMMVMMIMLVKMMAKAQTAESAGASLQGITHLQHEACEHLPKLRG
jgi:hypothetical protein